ncbi:MAG TPA: phosphopantetheine-binding protein, partial [Candidatus Acidoferrum sp.]|nr:phosphopantetheine-binding protein [Candidatus Acidoferrum sp.]
WMFLTGDLGRVTPEGGLMLLGRKDLQLKVRGFRVEPEQIERVLQRHPSVKEALVIGNAAADGAAQLVGYFTIVEPPAPKVDALRQFLAEHLPDYMIPSRFVRLDRLPLTPNGKVDRRALPASTGERPDLSAPYIEPTSALERKVAETWQEALYVSPVGLHDNFFDLGGDSLSAMRIVSTVNEIFGVELSLQVLFGAPTVAGTALIVVEQQGRHAGNATRERLLSEIEAMSEDEAELQIGLKPPQR